MVSNRAGACPAYSRFELTATCPVIPRTGANEPTSDDHLAQLTRLWWEFGSCCTNMYVSSSAAGVMSCFLTRAETSELRC